ncbi:MAG: hypothetical protein E7Z80_05235 [Methanobrevibacter thaueri]|nr:hypothetical protein [Methanobrevibacter thaueri]
MVISKNIKIKGHNCIINGDNIARCINITSNNNVVLENIIIINAYSNSDDGAGIHAGNNVTLTLINCVFKNNTVYNRNGGAISTNESCNVIIKNSYFENNTSIRESNLTWTEYKRGMGSALYHKLNSTVTITDSIFKSNNAYLSTILIVSYDDINFKQSKIHVNNSKFENNTSFRCGVIYIDEYGQGEILNSIFANNSSPGSRGILKLDTCSYSLVKNCKFINNNAVDGAAICITRFTKDNVSYVQIADCEFKNNHASENGGAISSTGGIVSINNCSFDNNTASQNGGAIYFKYNTLKITNSNFTNNNATYGGSIFSNADEGNIKHCIFKNNSGTNNGGSVYLKKYIYLNNCVYSNNSALKDKNKYGICNAFKIKGKIIANNFKTKYKSGKRLKITLKHLKLKKPIIGVKLKIKVKTGKKYRKYYAITNNKGEIKFKASKLHKGMHKVKISSVNNCVKAKKYIKIKIVK